MAFALVLPRRPLSQGAGGRGSFQEAVREAARRKFAGQEPLQGNLYARILWFHRQPTTQDVDNVVKNILDALKGVVYGDDVSIVQCIASKIDIARGYEIEDRYAPEEAFEELLSMLSQAWPDVLYIEIGTVSTIRVTFGPVDGGVE